MYLCSKTIGADQLHSYGAANLLLFFAFQKADFLMMQLILYCVAFQITILALPFNIRNHGNKKCAKRFATNILLAKLPNLTLNEPHHEILAF